MRPPSIAVITVGLLLTASCAHQPPGAATATVARSATAAHEQLEERQREFFAAVAAKDANRTAALFSDAAVLHVANMPPVEGRAAIHQFYGRMFGFLSASSATPESTQVSESGDMAVSIGRSANEFRGPEGPVEYAGKYVLVWRRLAGDWRIVLYGLSSNEPAAGPQGATP
jgi:ketosteroid isomerase-like protein